MEQAQYFQICIKDKGKHATPAPADGPVAPPLLDLAPNTSSVLDWLLPPPPPPQPPPGDRFGVTSQAWGYNCSAPGGGCTLVPLQQVQQPDPNAGPDDGGEDDGGGDGDCGDSGCDDPGPFLTKVRPAQDFLITPAIGAELSTHVWNLEELVGITYEVANVAA